MGRPWPRCVSASLIGPWCTSTSVRASPTTTGLRPSRADAGGSPSLVLGASDRQDLPRAAAVCRLLPEMQKAREPRSVGLSGRVSRPAPCETLVSHGKMGPAAFSFQDRFSSDATILSCNRLCENGQEAGVIFRTRECQRMSQSDTDMQQLVEIWPNITRRFRKQILELAKGLADRA